jgi:hypothetical protein
MAAPTLHKALEVRKALARKLTVRLSHGEHISHMAYMGATAFLDHHIVANIATVGFVVVVVNFVLAGFGHEEEE